MKDYEAKDDWQCICGNKTKICWDNGDCKKENQVLEIQHLSVNPSHRHMGIGTKMVQELKSKFLEFTIWK